ncbi:hypothetical protein F4678DRAFT_485842 [Xylaria arbuscula]|nr:hypothetical protein F4678DRAFT_485842 [Xylaria arbuscula]
MASTSVNDLLLQLESMNSPLAGLTESAQQFYEEREVYESERQIYDLNREKKRREADGRLVKIHDQSEEILERRKTAMFEIEQQKMMSILRTIDMAHFEFGRAWIDVSGIEFGDNRTQLYQALDGVDAAIAHFRDLFGQCRKERRETIECELMRINKPQSSEEKQQEGEVLSSFTPSDGNSDSNSTGTISSSLQTLVSEGSKGESHESSRDIHRITVPFYFEGNPPKLANLAAWLGLSSDVEVALLLNEKPIQNAYKAYRAPEGQSCADEPERLKFVLPLFTYSRETLLNWRSSGMNHSEQYKDGVDFSAALFSNQVVRYLEGSCQEVDWKPVSSTDSLGDYQLSKRRWAIALQIYWLMEKAFA